MKETKKNTSNTLQILSKKFLFFSHHARKKKPSPSELKVDEQIPNHKNSHNPSQSMKTPLKKSLEKKASIGFCPSLP
jgi:hypothetical protein